jgi:DNA repair photolyase
VATPVRWRTTNDNNPQGSLFDADALLDRHVGRGEYAGLEFLHVSAKSIINEVPAASHLPFRWTVNAYRGCSHACSYCFARPTHDYLGLNIGTDFDTQIVVKTNIGRVLRRELGRPSWSGEHVAMGTNTDPYQRAEGKYHLTRGIIEVLTEARNPFSILTKSSLILRDLDLLRRAREVTDVRVNLSIGTLDEATWKATEPGTPHPRQRVEAVRKLVAAGIETGVLVAPIIPGMSDGAEQLEAVTTACVEAGAASVSPILLFLKPGVREHWMDWLRANRPDLVPLYRRRYARGSRLPAADQQAVSTIVRRVAAEAAIDTADGDLRRITRQQRLGPGRPPPTAEPTPQPEPLTLL